MDLQTQLECVAEKEWNKEKMELLERFDSERKEWECQWKVMQKKIEELYQEVKLRRESNMNVFENKPTHNKAEEQFCSPILEWSDAPGINCCSPNKESLLNKAEKESKDMRNKRRNHAFVKDLLTSENFKKPDDCIGLKTTKNYTQDLNIALKELAKVSEDLCTYQEEIRKKANHRRCLKEMPSTAFSDIEKTRCLPWQKREAPPVPPRSTSRHFSNSLAEVSEAFAKDMEHKNICKIREHPDGNPFIYPAVPLAMIDEWKSVSEPTVAAMGITENQDQPLAQKFPADVYRNTWSCDASKVGNGPKNGTSSRAVQKCSSDENKHPRFQSSVHCTNNLYTPTCDTLDDSGYETGKTQRNETLEAKIDEFNRIVFHTDKGKKCLLQNQTPLVLSQDPRPHCVLQDSLISRTQIEEPSCVSNSRLSSTKEETSYRPSKESKTKGQQKQLNGLLSGYQHMFHEHDWRPGNLSGRPRSADSRSNYGVVEKLLKNYEKSALWNSRFHKEPQMQFESEFAEGNCKRRGHYPVIQLDQGKQEQQKNVVRHAGLYTKLGKEKQKFPEVSVTAKQSNGKGFSRPARPANRRLPSRWASRSPSAPPVMRRTLLNELS